MFDPVGFRKFFPELEISVNDHPLVYFDNAASSLKHSKVIERVGKYQKFEASNVHRGAHSLSHKGTENYEAARVSVQKFIGAQKAEEIIFTRGTTESINLVAQSFVATTLKPGDEILISSLEHHSNIVPWQALAKKMGFLLKVIPFDQKFGLKFEDYEKALGPKTKFVSLLWYSNAFGNRFPVEKLVEAARNNGAKILLDAAQVPLHETMDVSKLDVDFLTFSGHKMFAPYGIGALYGKESLLNLMDPYQYGGSMIDRVTFEKTTYAAIPQKFEAGTPNISGALGLGMACDILRDLGVEAWHGHLAAMREQLVAFLQGHKDYKVYDFESEDHTSVVSFNHNEAHPSDVGTLLDKYGIAVRAGHHCTQPLMAELGIPGTVRVSMAPYNTLSEVGILCDALEEIKEFF